MIEYVTIHGYNITIDPQFQNERYDNPPELINEMKKLFHEISNVKSKKIIERINNLILQYPKSPTLKNYLSAAYQVQGKNEKAKEVNDWILAEHPDYLFARINRANEFIQSKEFEKVPQILGEGMEIKKLYPQRDVFHLVEVIGFYNVVIRYYATIGNFELAKNQLTILEEIAPDHNDTEAAQDYLFQMQMQKGLEKFEERNKQRITPEIIGKPLPTFQKSKSPQFNHTKILNLYNFGLRIPKDMLREIIALPRITLIEDLEKILLDAAERFDYFASRDWNEEKNNFPLHAIFLLTEINAHESLPSIISFLEYEDEFLEFWLGDHRTTTLWRCFYGLCLNQTETIKQVLLQPQLDTYVKTSASEALCQMVLHHPEKRTEILNIYFEVFTFFSQANFEDDLIDSDFLGLAVGDVISCNLIELLPIIKILYTKNYVDLFSSGDYDDVEKEFKKIIKHDHARKLYSIYDLYDHITTSWAGYNEEETDFEEDDIDFDDDDSDEILTIPVQAVSKKIGRNEPCPCGSGKKYKKCHIGKL